MPQKFDVKTQAESLSKLMAMAERCIESPGGAIHAERLTDYVSNEFARLTPDQCIEVLDALDKDFEKRLLKDGYGAVIGYTYSKKVFVILRREQQSSTNEYAKLTKKIKSKG